ncbi:MAG: ABC transporter permease [Thermoleophilia bacterium]|jgi:lipooligosaccharide transport system permease protein
MSQGILSVTPVFLKVWQRNARVFITLWKFNFLPALAEPVLFIFVMGLGIGSYINEMEGVPYLEFVAAGILGSAAIMQATFECTYGSFFRMRIQNTFEGIISTPVSAGEVGLAEVMWGATRGLVNSSLVLLILLGLGILDHWQAVFIPVIMFLAATNFAALGIIVTTNIAQMEYFRFYFAGFVLPAQFICGTFFPVSRFPEAIQIFAWALPFTSFIDITRSLMLDRFSSSLLPEALWALGSTLLLSELAVRSMHHRLVT